LWRKKPIAKARLYATALGVYEASINGRRVSDELLAPGWADYTKRVMVQTYDVTKLIHPGQNAVGAVLGDGWYAGRLGWMGAAQYGTRPVSTPSSKSPTPTGRWTSSRPMIHGKPVG